MTGMQKRHLELGASIVRGAQPHVREALADAFVRLFREAPRFDAERFRAACFPAPKVIAPARVAEEWTLRGLYAHGWEDLTSEETWAEIMMRRDEYRENEPSTALRVIRTRGAS